MTNLFQIYAVLVKYELFGFLNNSVTLEVIQATYNLWSKFYKIHNIISQCCTRSVDTRWAINQYVYFPTNQGCQPSQCLLIFLVTDAISSRIIFRKFSIYILLYIIIQELKEICHYYYYILYVAIVIYIYICTLHNTNTVAQRQLTSHLNSYTGLNYFIKSSRGVGEMR